MGWSWKRVGPTSALWSAVLSGAIGVAVLGWPMPRAQAQQPAAACSAPFELVRLVHPLKRTAGKIATGEKLTVVAVGSSSTAGAGASSPAMSYPSRLAIDLQERFPGHPIVVLNRGINGEEAHDMLARFDSDVLADKPDLVLWQVGTNSVLRDHSLAAVGVFIREGIRRLEASGADIVLIDPQFVPRVIVKSEADAMVSLISAVAKEADIDLFQRFAVMRHWHQRGAIPFRAFTTPDDLHLNDWGYACWAKLLGSAVADAAKRAALQSVATRRPTARPVAP